jgi:hypothetical protein
VGHVVELDVLELVLERTYGIAVSFHLLIMAARAFHDLVDHELRVSPDIKALDVSLNGNWRAQRRASYSAMLFDVGKCTYCIPHVFSEGEMKSMSAPTPAFITDPSN